MSLSKYMYNKTKLNKTIEKTPMRLDDCVLLIP